MSRIDAWRKNYIFALDIGTRTVIGIIALVESGRLRVVAQHLVEHENRTMFDGQINDISEVAGTVLEVKRILEKKMGFKLDRVAIAAAGRSLITKRCRAEMEIKSEVEIDSTLINSLEITGIKNAYRKLDSDVPEGPERYYCVGYSVVRYYLNGYPITNLAGHSGSLISADILVTFLPESVVNSLYAVLRRAELEPVNLTLEPIAALEVLIPDNMRLLNLALVDIGAGTSDIAITRKGSVAAYGMVPVAGDEITECIAEAYLVDFNEAERIKRLLESGGDIVYKDILGTENTVPAAEVAKIIEPELDRLTAELTSTILSLNGGEPPRTVFCVGGGVRLPGLTDGLSCRLGIDSRKVAVRGREAVNEVIVEEEGLDGPEGVTVTGIGMVAVKRFNRNFVTVKVNGKEFILFNSKDLNVVNALGLVEFNPRDLIGYNGRDLKFALNGENRVIYGGLAKPAEIYINSNPANLKSLLREGDEINLVKAVNGKDAAAVVQDFLAGTDNISVTLNGEQKVVRPTAVLNEKKVLPHTEISDGDRLEIKVVKTIRELLEGTDLSKYNIRVNGTGVDPDYALQNGDDIRLTDKIDLDKGMPVSVTVNGNPVELKGGLEHIFADVLNWVELDGPDTNGVLVLKLNGEAAGYTDLVKDGDNIEIYWEQPRGKKGP
jgi:cell division protein FtsA